MSKTKRTANVPPFQSFPAVDPIAIPFVDEIDADNTIVGYAPLGVKENEEGWYLIKYETNGTVTKTLFPKGEARWDKKWSDRLNYNYSR